MATGMVLYLSSQRLTDSLTKAKAELAAAQAKQTDAGQPAKLTAEQEAEMQKACEAIKNFDLGKAIADATAQMGKEIGGRDEARGGGRRQERGDQQDQGDLRKAEDSLRAR